MFIVYNEYRITRSISNRLPLLLTKFLAFSEYMSMPVNIDSIEKEDLIDGQDGSIRRW